jgi:hypothetical protein
VTPAQQKRQLSRIVSTWRNRLALDHVVLEIEWGVDPDEPDALASVLPSDLYDHAILRFRDDWHEHELEMLNRIVVHELLHIMFRDFGNAIRSINVTGALSTDLRLLWHDRCMDAEEGLVDRLANRYVELGGIVE